MRQRITFTVEFLAENINGVEFLAENINGVEFELIDSVIEEVIYWPIVGPDANTVLDLSVDVTNYVDLIEHATQRTVDLGSAHDQVMRVIGSTSRRVYSFAAFLEQLRPRAGPLGYVEITYAPDRPNARTVGVLQRVEVDGEDITDHVQGADHDRYIYPHARQHGQRDPRPLTIRDPDDTDRARWADEIDDEPTSTHFEPTAEPPSDDIADLMDRIAAELTKRDAEEADDSLDQVIPKE